MHEKIFIPDTTIFEYRPDESEPSDDGFNRLISLHLAYLNNPVRNVRVESHKKHYDVARQGYVVTSYCLSPLRIPL